MKQLGTIKGILLMTLLLASCGGQAQKSQSEPVDQTSDVVMSGWKCYGLQGRVESVEYTDGTLWKFNTDGNIVLKKSESEDEERDYQSATKYVIDESLYEIVFEDDLRKEMLVEDNEEGFFMGYRFDPQGRIINWVHAISYSLFVEEFIYPDATALLPSSYKTEGPNENFSSESKFEYLKTDEKGNWLERKVSETYYGDEAATERIEKRTIKYF